MNGKGDKPRPMNISQEEFAIRWEKAFKKEERPKPKQDDPVEELLDQIDEELELES